MDIVVDSFSKTPMTLSQQSHGDHVPSPSGPVLTSTMDSGHLLQLLSMPKCWLVAWTATQSLCTPGSAFCRVLDKARGQLF